MNLGGSAILGVPRVEQLPWACILDSSGLVLSLLPTPYSLLPRPEGAWSPTFENKDNVLFDDSHTREVLQLEWKHKVADEVKAWVERIKELGTYFLG